MDLLSGAEGFKLVSIASGDPSQTPDDIAGWTPGTPDRKGQLRAERSDRGRERIYCITYEAVDRAGNTARATATVVVPDRR